MNEHLKTLDDKVICEFAKQVNPNNHKLYLCQATERCEKRYLNKYCARELIREPTKTEVYK